MSSDNLYQYWWGFFHRLSLIIENRANYDHLVHLGLNLLDCDHCRTDALKFYQNLESSLTPFEKMHHLHNHVNEITKKTIYTLEQSYALYQDTIGLDDKITWSVFFKKYFDLLFTLTHSLTPAQIPTFREFTSYLTETIPITNSVASYPIFAQKHHPGPPSPSAIDFNRTELFKETYEHYLNLIQKTPQLKLSLLKFDQIYTNTQSPSNKNVPRAVTNFRKGGCKKCAERKRQKELHYQQKMMKFKEAQNKPKNISPFLGQKDLSPIPKSKTTISPPITLIKPPSHRVIRQVPTQLQTHKPQPVVQLRKTIPKPQPVYQPRLTETKSGQIIQQKSRNKPLIYRSKNKGKTEVAVLNQTKPNIPLPRVIRVSHRNQNIPKTNQHVRMIKS
jgi:hypothetical protein